MSPNTQFVTHWLETNGLTPSGSQQSQDMAVAFMNAMREAAQNPGDTRNISDRFRSWENTEDIRADLSADRSGLINVCLNVQGDFNLATVVRLSNWYNAQGVWVAGRRKWDKRGAVGTHHYTQVTHKPDIMDALSELRADGYRLVAAEITDHATPVTTYQWEHKTAVVYGEEGAGLTREVVDFVDDVVYIPGRGSVRSLNVGVTAGVLTHDYHQKLNYI